MICFLTVETKTVLITLVKIGKLNDNVIGFSFKF